MKQAVFDPQRREALNKANEVRTARAALKERIKQGDITAAEIILAPPASVGNWSVSQLLMSQRRWGSQRCRRFLASQQIKELKPICELTERQRRLLAEQLATQPVAPAAPARRRTPELQYA